MKRRDWFMGAAAALTSTGAASAQQNEKKTGLAPQDWYHADLAEYLGVLDAISQQQNTIPWNPETLNPLQRAAMLGINAYESFKQGKPTQVTIKQFVIDNKDYRTPRGVKPYQGVLCDMQAIDVPNYGGIFLDGATFLQPTTINLSQQAGYGEINLTNVNAPSLTITSSYVSPGKFFRAREANLEGFTFKGGLEKAPDEQMDFAGSNLKNAKFIANVASSGRSLRIPFNYEGANLTGADLEIAPANLKRAVVMNIKDEDGRQTARIKQIIGSSDLPVEGAVFLGNINITNDYELKTRLRELGAITEIRDVIEILNSAPLRAQNDRQAENIAGPSRIAAQELLTSREIASTEGLTPTQRSQLETAVKAFDKRFPTVKDIPAMSQNVGQSMSM
jgi:uncharacterized protein YjbI with pentapeptide repeats